MRVELKNKKLFMSLLSMFKIKDKIDVTISTHNILFEAVELQKYYLSLPNTMFSTENSCDKFTINPKFLYNALSTLDTNCFEVLTELIEVKNATSCIKIPFVACLSHDYAEIEDVCTKFVLDIKTFSVFSQIKGLVKYEKEEKSFFVRKIGKNVVEEIELKNFVFCDSGELSFACNHIWIDLVDSILHLVDNILFLCNGNILSAQFLFKNEEKIFLEVQIPKLLI